MKPTTTNARVTTDGYGALINVSVNGKCIGWITPSALFRGSWFWVEHGKKPTGKAESKASAIAALVAAYEGNGEAGE